MTISLDLAATPLPEKTIYSVSELNRNARDLLETSFPLIRVEGEISNLAQPRSGHVYFSLKDATAQIRCAMFRRRNRRLAFTPADGMQVMVLARVSLYETRGEFQLIVEQMEEAGDGALRRAFEALKQRLSAEGLFDAEHKRQLPVLPRRIGVITSPTGAALRDILSVLKRRFAALGVIVYPTAVQGTGAAKSIAAMIQIAAARNECDVLIIARGGGSLEDLWAFNEESLARAVAACPIPLVSGVGHETDVTIADFAADIRAPTPTGAAELVTPDQGDWLRRFAQSEQRLVQVLLAKLVGQDERLAWCRRRLAQLHPERRIKEHMQRLDELEQRLNYVTHNLIESRRVRLTHIVDTLRRLSPATRLHTSQERVEALRQRLANAVNQHTATSRQRLTVAVRTLDTISPLATLTRGYAIVTDTETGEILRDAGEVSTGQRIKARLNRGSFTARVESEHS